MNDDPHFVTHGDDYVELGCINHVPGNVSFLSIEPGESFPFADITCRYNSNIQHAVLDKTLSASYYDNYLMTTSFSKKIGELQQGQIDRLLEISDGKIKSFIEVGCGDGAFLAKAKRAFSYCLGVEPSSRFASEALKKNLDVIVGYVGREKMLTEEKFDAFASRQVFEHLDDPLGVLFGIKAMLNPGAIGFIEVPNGFRSLKSKRFFDFFPDHINYFSVNSLVALASAAGFNVISCAESFGGDYLELWMRYEEEAGAMFNDMLVQRELACRALESTVAALTAEGKRVVIWGCGAKTLSILAACHPQLLSAISGVVDSDPHKFGRYVPNSSLKVFSPDGSVLLHPDVVIVLALSYREEIAETVRRILPECRHIFSMVREGTLAEL